MDHGKLFGVLVIGGAMLACGGSGPSAVDAATPNRDGGNANDAAPTADDAATTDDAGAMQCGFCPNEACCEMGPDGPRERPGLVCCWGTTC